MLYMEITHVNPGSLVSLTLLYPALPVWSLHLQTSHDIIKNTSQPTSCADTETLCLPFKDANKLIMSTWHTALALESTSVKPAMLAAMLQHIPSWLYSALPGKVRNLTARDAKPESEDEAAQTEWSDCGDADTVSVKPVMQQAMAGWHACIELPLPADELVVASQWCMIWTQCMAQSRNDKQQLLMGVLHLCSKRCEPRKDGSWEWTKNRQKEKGMIDTFADDKGFSSSLGGNARVVLPVAYKSTEHAQKESNRDILPMMPVILQYRHCMCKLAKVGVVL